MARRWQTRQASHLEQDLDDVNCDRRNLHAERFLDDWVTPEGLGALVAGKPHVQRMGDGCEHVARRFSNVLAKPAPTFASRWTIGPYSMQSGRERSLTAECNR